MEEIRCKRKHSFFEHLATFAEKINQSPEEASKQFDLVQGKDEVRSQVFSIFNLNSTSL